MEVILAIKKKKTNFIKHMFKIFRPFVFFSKTRYNSLKISRTNWNINTKFCKLCCTISLQCNNLGSHLIVLKWRLLKLFFCIICKTVHYVPEVTKVYIGALYKSSLETIRELENLISLKNTLCVEVGYFQRNKCF